MCESGPVFKNNNQLQIIPGISFGRLDKIFDIFGKGKHHIHDDRRPHSNYGSVDKILPDT